eukprot:6455420-Amphidinium_carterae.1
MKRSISERSFQIVEVRKISSIQCQHIICQGGTRLLHACQYPVGPCEIVRLRIHPHEDVEVLCRNWNALVKHLLKTQEGSGGTKSHPAPHGKITDEER